jgi:hypothetical protein
MPARKPTGAKPKTVVQSQILTLDWWGRGFSFAAAIGPAIALYFLVTQTKGDQSVLVPNCKHIAANCVAVVSRTPDSGVELALLGISLVFALFATTGVVWTITTALLTTAPFVVTNTSASDPGAKAAPTVKSKLTNAAASQVQRIVRGDNVQLNFIKPIVLNESPADLRTKVPDDVWAEAEQRWKADYGGELLSNLDDVRHSAGSDTYYVIATVPGGNIKRAIKVVRQ